MPAPRPETEIEAAICTDPDWERGMAWGAPRRGHPEGSVGAHTIEVLALVDVEARDPRERARLRLVALVHDACKVDVLRGRPPTRDNDHARLARRLAERHVTDPAILLVIERHEDAFRLWIGGSRRGRWARAEEGLADLASDLHAHDAIELYVRFTRADTNAGDKDQAPVWWLEDRLAEMGYR